VGIAKAVAEPPHSKVGAAHHGRWALQVKTEDFDAEWVEL